MQDWNLLHVTIFCSYYSFLSTHLELLLSVFVWSLNKVRYFSTADWHLEWFRLLLRSPLCRNTLPTLITLLWLLQDLSAYSRTSVDVIFPEQSAFKELLGYQNREILFPLCTPLPILPWYALGRRYGALHWVLRNSRSCFLPLLSYRYNKLISSLKSYWSPTLFRMN